MFCILGPEMSLGDPQHAPRKRHLFDSAGRKSKKIRWKLPDRPGDARHHTLGSVFSGFSYNSMRSSVTTRAASVKITRREKKVPMRAQDIFTQDSNGFIPNRASTPGHESTYGSNTAGSPKAARGRCTTPMSTLSLDKALPALPDGRSDFDADVSVHDIEGYIDMLAYLRRDLPTKPKPDQPAPAAAPQAIIRPPVKEEEWISSRSQSRQSTTYTASEDEIHRMRSRSTTGMLLHSASASRKTVTPMSSMGSDADLRGASSKTLLAPAPAPSTARIEEVSEPGTSTPRRRSALMPLTCYHCGRDPSGRDAKDSPMTVLGAHESSRAGDVERDGPGATRATSPSTSAEEDKAQRHTPCTETSFYSAMEEAHSVDSDAMPEPADEGNADADVSEHTSPFARPSNPDPYAATEGSPAQSTPTRNGQSRDRAAQAEQEIDIGIWLQDPDNEPPLDMHHIAAWPSPPVAQPSPYRRAPNPDPYSSANSPSPSPALRDYDDDDDEDGHHAPEKNDLEIVGLERSFWKNPDGVIFVYQGVEANGHELYFGNDINYLGSFYDDDEGSSGLGSTKNSTADLVGAGSGLAMIPEGPGSSEDLWDDEVFGA